MSRIIKKPPPITSIFQAVEKGKIDAITDFLTNDHSLINSTGKMDRTPVMVAAVTGQNDIVTFLVKNKCDVTCVDERGDNALHLACVGGNVEIVKTLLAKKGLGMEDAGRFGQTPVMKAVYHGHIAVFEFLYNKRCVVKGLDSNGNNILHIAVLGGNVKMVTHVIEKKVTVIESKGQYGQTPVMLAAGMGNKEIFDLLVSRGAKLSGTDDNGDGIVHISCSGDNEEILEYVLSKEEEQLNTRGQNGRTPVMKAAETGHKNMFDILVSRNCDFSNVDNDGNNLLHVACSGGSDGIVGHILRGKICDIESRGEHGRTPVLMAAYAGQKEVLDLLISEGGDLKAVDDLDDTLLHIASYGGEADMVKHLITKGIVGINIRGKYGRTAAMVAASKGDKKIFEFLVNKGCDLSMVDTDGNGVLHVACAGGDLDMVKFILTQKNIDKECVGQYGRTPIMVAADFGHKPVFTLLLKSGCALNTVDQEGDNMLHIASYGGNLDILREIISKNVVKLESRGKYGRTAAMKAAEKGNKEVFVFLVSKNCDLAVKDANGNNLLHVVCSGGNTELVKSVLGLEVAEIDCKGMYGMTPLMKAAEGGHLEILDLLIEKGSDMTLIDTDGDNCLHVACTFGQVQMVKHILSLSKISKESRGKYGRTPLMSAARKGHKDVFDFLDAENCDLTCLDNNGDNTFHIACNGGNVDMVRHLISKNFYGLERKGRYGQTPLLKAAFFGHIAVLDLLVERGANTEVVDRERMNLLHTAAAGGCSAMVKHVLHKLDFDKECKGKYNRTPLLVAAEKGQKKAFDLLVEEGCDVHAVNSQGDNILHLATMGGNLNMVKYILSLNIVALESKGQYGQTPLMKAASRGHIAIFDYLAQIGSDPSLVCDGDNIFHVACLGGNVKMVQHVLDMKLADKESKGKYEQTGLMKAASMGHKGVFDMLISLGCDLSLVDQDGDTLLHVSCFGGNLEIVKYLTTLLGVETKRKNKASQTPLQVAETCGHTHIAEWMRLY